jgi:hypothetical protein
MVIGVIIAAPARKGLIVLERDIIGENGTDRSAECIGVWGESSCPDGRSEGPWI